MQRSLITLATESVLLATLSNPAFAITSDDTKSANVISLSATITESIDNKQRPSVTLLAHPKDAPRAVMLAIHGLSLHKGSFQEFADQMADAGVSTYGLDVRGFGALKDEKLDLQKTMVDIETVLKFLHESYPYTPVFLVGESMGGALALQATVAFPTLVDGLISSVPANGRFKENRSNAVVALHALNGPNKEFPIREVARVSNDPKVIEKLASDPETRSKLSPAEFVRFRSFTKQSQTEAKKLQNTPVLMLQGANDKLIKPTSTLKLFELIPDRNKDLLVVGGVEHLVLEEGQFTDTVIDAITNWVSRHVQSAIASANAA